MYRNITRFFNRKAVIGVVLLTLGCAFNQSESRAWWSALYPDLGLEQAAKPIGDSANTPPTVTSDFQIKWYFGEENYDEFFGETFCEKL